MYPALGYAWFARYAFWNNYKFFPAVFVIFIYSCSKMLARIITFNSPDYIQMVGLRDKILRKPLGIPLQPEELQREKDDILMGVFDHNRLLGCCILSRHTASDCRLRQMAVDDSVQTMGIGTILIRFAEHTARTHGYKNMVLHARKVAVAFYLKCGYAISSDVFFEVTIPHYEMTKRLH